MERVNIRDLETLLLHEVAAATLRLMAVQKAARSQTEDCLVEAAEYQLMALDRQDMSDKLFIRINEPTCKAYRQLRNWR